MPNNLPAHATPFIGREQHLELIRTRLVREGVRLLTLTGPGGTGKTRLALQAAAHLLGEFPDGAFVVSLAPLSRPDLVPAAIAQVLGVVPRAGGPVLAALKAHLQDKALLLLLDNFEHLAAAATTVAELLAASPGLRVLVTSRAVLHLYGEHDVAVPPLALPDRRSAPTAQYVRQFESVRLFLERARAARSDFALVEANAAAVAELCQRLDGLPLAIELAAARLRALPVPVLLARIERRLPLLTGGPRDVPARQRTLRATIDWSYRLLASDERLLLQRLAVFRGCTLEAVEAVCWAPNDQPGSSNIAVPPLGLDVVEGLTALIDNSLLRQDQTVDGRPWYSMLETIREYALERLAASDETDAIHRRHALYYLKLAESADPELVGPQQAAWFARLEQEHDNLRAALGWCEERKYAEPALRLPTALWWFWAVRGHASEGRQHLAALLTRFRPPATAGRLIAARARALQAAGNLAAFQGDHTSARALHEQALLTFRAQGDLAGVEGALQALGLVASRQGDHQAARALLTEALELARAGGDRSAIGGTLYNLANAVHEQGDYATARALLEESVALKRETGPLRDVGIGLTTLGVVLQDQGDLKAAQRLYVEGVAGCREAGDQRAVALALANLGSLATAQADYTAARAALSESATIQQKLGDPAGVAFVLERFARLAVAQHQHDRAVRLAGAAAAVRETIGAQLPPAARARFDEWLEPARRALGEPATASAWEAGWALSPEAVIAQALEAQEPALTLTTAPAAGDGLPALTPREREVAALIARGYTNRQIAAELVITEGTAASHVNHILDKLAFSSRAQIAVWSAQHPNA